MTRRDATTLSRSEWIVAQRMTEAQLYQHITARVVMHPGALLAHFTQSVVAGHGKPRVITAQQGHKGFPDVVIGYRGRAMFRELKRQAVNAAEPAQQLWLAAVGGSIWRPADLLEGVIDRDLAAFITGSS